MEAIERRWQTDADFRSEVRLYAYCLALFLFVFVTFS